MTEQAEPEVLSYSVRQCRRCDVPMLRVTGHQRRTWCCERCGRTAA